MQDLPSGDEPEPPLITRDDQLKAAAKATAKTGAKAKAKGKAKAKASGRARGRGRGRGPTAPAPTTKAVEVCSSQETARLAPPEEPEEDGVDEIDEPVFKKPAAKAQKEIHEPVFKKPAAKAQKKRGGPQMLKTGKEAKVGGDVVQTVEPSTRQTFAGRRSPDHGQAKDRFVALQVAYFTFVTPKLESPSTHEAGFLAKLALGGSV